jgi:hypothetical protein
MLLISIVRTSIPESETNCSVRIIRNCALSDPDPVLSFPVPDLYYEVNHTGSGSYFQFFLLLFQRKVCKYSILHRRFF